MRGYLKLRELGYKAVVLLKYEELVVDPARLVARFAKAIGLPPQRAVKAVDRAAKVHGDSNNHAKALQNIESGAHLKKYSAEELAATCRLLDPELLRLTGYRECLRRIKNDTHPSPDWEAFALGVPSDPAGAAGATAGLEASAATLGAVDTPVEKREGSREKEPQRPKE